jgi:hypothetical protein
VCHGLFSIMLMVFRSKHVDPIAATSATLALKKTPPVAGKVDGNPMRRPDRVGREHSRDKSKTGASTQVVETQKTRILPGRQGRAATLIVRMPARIGGRTHGGHNAGCVAGTARPSRAAD